MLINSNASQYTATFKTHWCIVKLSYISVYMVLYSTDSHWSISLKVQEGNVIWHKTLRMLKFHPIPAFMKTYTNFKKIFLIRVFWLKYIFRIKFKIRILDLILLRVPFKGLYSSNMNYCTNQKKEKMAGLVLYSVCPSVCLLSVSKKRRETISPKQMNTYKARHLMQSICS